MVFRPQPKPKFRSQRAKLKRLRKRKDREIQIDTETETCAIGGHYAEQTAGHHVIRRKHLATRHDPSNIVRLCYYHHMLLHSLGRDDFNKRVLKESYVDVSDMKL